jgi:UDP-N-acetylglucosamine--N-acetylmuramyl-(pentapeptide) pyrophosphoryl-undecaprenol N-acetylglucosamine transferase
MTGPIILAAGGTGGHLFPAQALAQELTARGRRVVLITDLRRGQAIAESFPGIEIAGVRAGTPTAKSTFGKVIAAGDIVMGVVEAITVLRALRPSLVVGFGGYPSLPPAFGALMLGIPLCLHEQNAVLGRVNKLLGRYAKAIATSFPDVAGLPAHARVTLTGNPVRKPITEIATVPYQAIDATGEIRLLIVGGSQGARIFSEVVPNALRLLPQATRQRLRLVQQVRAEHLPMVRTAYQDAGISADLRVFVDDMPAQLAAAHLVIGRGGASTVAELLAAGRPSLIAPYPFHADQHQLKNALNLVNAGAGWVLPDALMTPASLALKLATLIGQPHVLEQAAAAAKSLGRLNAASDLADVVERLAPSSTNAPKATRVTGAGGLMREAAQ